MNNDTPERKPIKEDDDSSGQNPFWPGDKALKPGTRKSKDDGRDEETTTIPEVR
jgi:hypothetical protein